MENSWYKFKYGGKYLYGSNEENNWSRLWGVGYPYNDFSYQSGQYGLFNLGANGWLTIRNISAVDDLEGGYENVWSLYTNSNKTHGAVNYRYRNDDNPEDKNFPQLINRLDGKIKPEKSNGNNNMEIVEVANPTFHPEKWYYLEDHGYRIKDDKGNEKWRILVEGKFFKFVSGNGYILKGHHYVNNRFGILSSGKTDYSVDVTDKSFPNNYDDANAYFRAVWAVVSSGSGNYYYIKNIFYPQHFLSISNNQVQLKRSDYGDQIKITEIK